MRCIFCKKDSSSSRSREHILPESIGNTHAVLPPGVVCDRCNNYFASNVEKPLLSAGAFKSLRHHQAIPSKKGRFPALDGLILPDIPVLLERESAHDSSIVSVERPHFARLLSRPQETGVLLVPVGEMPTPSVMSRFLAKCAVEALAERWLRQTDWLDVLIDDASFDPLRSHARLGSPRTWAFHQRAIYDANRTFVGRDGHPFQTLWEYDFLMPTPDNVRADGSVQSELFFVLAIFGLELTINVGGPELDGYEQWLRAHGDVSPLYIGRNERVFERGV